jgi:hypothetical protein
VHKVIVSAVTLVALACSAPAATPTTPKKRRHPGTTTSAQHAPKHSASASKAKPPRAPKASTKAPKAGKVTARHKGKKTRAAVRSYQQAPTPDRYREIQQALASKGYFQGEPNGEWGADSTDALKRFQASQNLMPDGKINSLSLIALGLGPKKLTAKSDAQPPPQVTPATTSPLPTPAAPPPQ